mmetsp:Transcript_27070/g.40098  ORF Transcript_27070/g.40098 Transcript_27070/m.40098 type:complete len:85 (+) Transcript_27070:880-1134(+)
MNGRKVFFKSYWKRIDYSLEMNGGWELIPAPIEAYGCQRLVSTKKRELKKDDTLFADAGNTLVRRCKCMYPINLIVLIQADYCI